MLVYLKYVISDAATISCTVNVCILVVVLFLLMFKCLLPVCTEEWYLSVRLKTAEPEFLLSKGSAPPVFHRNNTYLTWL